MKKRWFQDDDGTYYRNEGLVWGEMRRARRLGRLIRAAQLHREWQTVWDAGVARKDKLDRRDKVVVAAPFCRSYPDKPGLWSLDPVGCGCGRGTYSTKDRP